jgi:hypothetical protein
VLGVAVGFAVCVRSRGARVGGSASLGILIHLAGLERLLLLPPILRGCHDDPITLHLYQQTTAPATTPGSSSNTRNDVLKRAVTATSKALPRSGALHLRRYLDQPHRGRSSLLEDFLFGS